MASGPVDPEVLLRLKGERGNRGNQGLMGHKGYQGQVGPAGFPGEPGRPGPEGGNTGQGDDTFCFRLRKLFFSYVFSQSKKKWRNFIILAKLFLTSSQPINRQEGNLDQTLKMDYWKKFFLTCPSGLPYLRYKTHRCFLIQSFSVRVSGPSKHVNDVSGHQKTPDRKTVFGLSPFLTAGWPLGVGDPPLGPRHLTWQQGLTKPRFIKLEIWFWKYLCTCGQHLKLLWDTFSCSQSQISLLVFQTMKVLSTWLHISSGLNDTDIHLNQNTVLGSSAPL